MIQTKQTEIMDTISVLSESVRLSIVKLVADSGRLCAKDILEYYDLSQPTLSHHLSTLVNSGILLAEKSGRNVYYSVNSSEIYNICSFLESFVSEKTVREVPKPSLKPVMEEEPVKVIKEKDSKKKKKKDKKKKK